MLLRECRYFLVGGAGFIGSHFTDTLLASPLTRRVTIFDNFSSGLEWHLEQHRADPRLAVIRADASDINALTATMDGHDWVIHLASNPDISLAAENPEIDFYRGTLLTHNVVEAMRRAHVHRLIYASGSGVYGDAGDTAVAEDHGPLRPVSTYGASKLAGEALIASYCSMFGLHACAFRFGNVVGPRQTHGVGFDFVRRLAAKPNRLRILGDGQQSKPYIHVTDVVDAVLCAAANASARFSVFNVATDDAVTVTEIAELAAEVLGLLAKPTFEYTGGRSGWRGDVPVVRLDSSRMRALGWFPKWNSREAVRRSLEEMVADERVLQQ
jgi:UDP-glucose 4-epimerase